MEQSSVLEGKQGHLAALWKEGSELELNQQPTPNSVTSDSWGYRHSEGFVKNAVGIGHILHMNEACRGRAG